MNRIYYKIDDWIGDNYNKISSKSLSSNPFAIELMLENEIKFHKSEISKNTNDLFIKHFLLLPKNQVYINWSDFSMNFADEAVSHLFKNLDKINWISFSRNSNSRVIDYLEKNPNKIVWSSLSANPSAIKILKENKHRIDYEELSKNTNPEVLDLYKNNKKRLNWSYLSRNSAAVKLLLLNKTSIQKIDWIEFNRNESKEAVDYLIKNPKYICEYTLSMNKFAIDFLKANPDKINWESIGYNKGIFIINYRRMKRKFKVIAEEIYTKAVHPKRICRLIEEYGDEEVYKNFFDE